MSIKIIQERLNSYKANSFQEEEMALREITQEVALYALFNTDFYKHAAFQGGTCLRILYNLNRFSEDLDFALIEPDITFSFKNYQNLLRYQFEAFGYEIEIIEKKETESTVKSIFIKEDSIGKILNLQFQKSSGQPKSIRIKLEIDTNPPLGGVVENKYHDFPLNFFITAYKLSSLFAGKIHALLTRNYTKGRDWYDFLWYAARKTEINFILLKNALDQTAKLPSQDHQIDKNWFLSKMGEKIESTDWEEAKKDIHRFMKPIELKSLELWSKDFFLSKLQNF